MKPVKNLRQPLYGLILLFVISVPLVYYWLGGFNRLQVELVSIEQHFLLGHYFEGRQKSDTIRNYFEEMKGYLQRGTYPGQLVVIYDQEPIGRSGMVKVFVGIRMATSPLDIPSHLQSRTIEGNQAIRISKAAHSALMPNPRDLNKIIAAYALERSLELQGPNMEVYLPDNRLVVEQPLTP